MGGATAPLSAERWERTATAVHLLRDPGRSPAHNLELYVVMWQHRCTNHTHRAKPGDPRSVGGGGGPGRAGSGNRVRQFVALTYRVPCASNREARSAKREAPGVFNRPGNSNTPGTRRSQGRTTYGCIACDTMSQLYRLTYY